MLSYDIDSFMPWNWYRLDENNESAWGIHLVCSSAKASSINLMVQSHPPLPLWYHLILSMCIYQGLSRFMTCDIIWAHILIKNYTVSVPGVGWSFVRRFPPNDTETIFEWKTAFTVHVDSFSDRSVGRRLRKVTFKWKFTDCVLDRDLFAAGDKSNVSVSQMNCVRSLHKTCNCIIV